MRIWTYEGGYDNNFSYLLAGDDTQDAAIIDAAVPFTEIEPIIESEQLNVNYLLITHTHGDHTAYAREYRSSLEDIQIAHFGGGSYPESLSLSDGDTLSVGQQKINVIHTPGHYPDSVCFQTEKCLFSGDTLFVGRTGRTISPQGDSRQLYRSVYEKHLPLPGDTVIYPGHNYGHQPTITLKDNIAISTLLQSESEDDFVDRMAQYERSRTLGS